MPFDPLNLTPNSSLNRVRIMEAPGLPAELSGRLAYELLSRQFLLERIRENRAALDIPPDLPDDALFIELERCLVERNPAAEVIAAQMGRNLGFLLLVLKRGDPANQAARSEWDGSHWAQWGVIQHVILGGGVVAGRLGQKMLETTRPMLNGMVSVEISLYAASLPLIGAARQVESGASHALVFDFGGTRLKAALATYSGDTLIALEKYASSPTDTTMTHAPDLLNHLADFVARTWKESRRFKKSPQLIVSLSSYLENGQPVAQGYYGCLRDLGEKVSDLLAEAIHQRTQVRHRIKFLHDGSAAAAVYAGSPHTAVIMMGTALGVGFALPDKNLRPVSKTLRDD